MSQPTNCEYCYNYSYNEEFDYYECMMYLDEDEMGKFLSGSLYQCPHFQYNDEYKIAKKQ